MYMCSTMESPTSNYKTLIPTYPLIHNISWSRGGSLKVSIFANPSSEVSGKVVAVKIEEENESEYERRVAYGSVTPFALLQSRRNADQSFYEADWWEYIMEYSRDINRLLGSKKLPGTSLIEDPKKVLKNTEEPTCLKAAWELLELFYAVKA